MKVRLRSVSRVLRGLDRTGLVGLEKAIEKAAESDLEEREELACRGHRTGVGPMGENVATGIRDIEARASTAWILAEEGQATWIEK